MCVILRYRFHVDDLAFLEDVERVWGAAQLKIRSEVASSNSQSKKIAEEISKLKSHIEEKNKQVGIWLPQRTDAHTQTHTHIHTDLTFLSDSL